MAIVRWWDPWKDLALVQEKMNRLFEDTIARRGREEGLGAAMWAPDVDIYETENEIVVKAEVPGVDKEQIAIEVKDGVLTLRGERKFEKEVKEENYHRMERSYGGFMRSFSVPSSVDADRIGARLKDGVLEVKLPKADKAKPRQIKVDVK
jgi:HSP20 family protein